MNNILVLSIHPLFIPINLLDILAGTFIRRNMVIVDYSLESKTPVCCCHFTLKVNSHDKFQTA